MASTLARGSSGREAAGPISMVAREAHRFWAKRRTEVSSRGCRLTASHRGGEAFPQLGEIDRDRARERSFSGG